MRDDVRPALAIELKNGVTADLPAEAEVISPLAKVTFAEAG
jgi:hypothetical protein